MWSTSQIARKHLIPGYILVGLLYADEDRCVPNMFLQSLLRLQIPHRMVFQSPAFILLV
ncbi:hypothetical protein J42TS3_50760 [Paenibacillus vini]|uniref:Uncharacterized protein n=1 Tax=Paenibacillus vini TaxID=1476024 RepID=A0ABQ4MJ85_9BACL|nr:hypothetical protein J42TS3_50760 [Paenibacillus vini]